MIDFSKIYCNMHPHELITNFCCAGECLIGLCANCVCTHTQFHMNKGTAPEYENIRATYKKVQENIRLQVELFEKDKARIDKISEKVTEKREKVKQIMNIAKDEVSLLLGDYFEEKEKNMLREIQAQQKKYGLHCQSRLQSLNSYVSREVSSLVSAAQEISSTNFLQSLPRVRTQHLVNSAKIHEEIQNEIIQNEFFSTTISCDKGLLKNLVDILEKAITVRLSNYQHLDRLQRPKSQGKRQNSMEPASAPKTYYPSIEKSSDSQISIGQRYNFPQQTYTHNSRPIGENRRSSYLNDIHNYGQHPKIQDSAYQRLGPTHYQNEPSFSFKVIPQSTCSMSLNNIGCQEPFSTHMGSQSPVNLLGEKQDTSRNGEKQISNGTIGNQTTSSSIPQVYQAGKSYDHITGLSKKSKKSGLRIMTASENQAFYVPSNRSIEAEKYF